MTARLLVPVALVVWVGAALVLSELRWFARRPLADRLRPYTAGASRTTTRAGLLSVESFRDVVGPLSQAVGTRVARVFGVHEDLGGRLQRVHSPLDAVTFRVRQIGWAALAFGGAGLLALAVRPPAAFGLLLVLGAPLLVFLELPVVSEQIGTLIAAGHSLGSALARVADRGAGTCAHDLRRVLGRVRQGLSEVDALREWAVLAEVDALDRLVGVLALNREAGDLGHLISEEARSIRREAQRQLVEQIERRSQQVWIPVTVATLVPGTLFLAVPFFQAMRLFAGS
jgi:tight adherence protein C